MTQIYIADSARSNVIKIPVPPAELSISEGQDTQIYNTVGAGEVMFIGRRTLDEISWSSFFPATPRGYDQSGDMYGVDYIRALESMRQSREPLHLTVSALGISLDCVIKSLKWSQKRGRDIYYEITLAQYRGVNDG